MSIAHLLENFDTHTRGIPISITDVSLEEEKLQAFEKGYQAGWEDSLKSQSESARHVTTDLAQNLKDLSFSYEEAYSAIMKALRPLLEQILKSVIPELSQATLVPRLTNILHDMARERGRLKVELVGSSDDFPILEKLADDLAEFDLKLSESETLVSGQVQLKFGEDEHEIDLRAVLQGIETAVYGFFEQNGKVVA